MCKYQSGSSPNKWKGMWLWFKPAFVGILDCGTIQIMAAKETCGEGVGKMHL